MEFDLTNDPFSDPVLVENQTYQPFDEGAQYYTQSAPFSVENNAPEDLEELKRQADRDLENKERQKKLIAKDEKERLQKDAKRKQARAELSKWYEDRNKVISQNQQHNILKEKQLIQSKASGESSWKKVGSMIDFKDTSDRKDLARMRAVLLAKKHE
jgi:Clathrin light chain